MRLFVAVDLPDTIKKQLEALRHGIPDAKWVPEGNAHLTLAFLGEISDADLGDIGLALGRISHTSFDLKIRSVDVFGNARRPRVLWAGIQSNSDLEALQQKVCNALGQAGFSLEERRFRPHITLARIHMSPYERVRSFLTDHSLFCLPEFEISSFTLFSSHLAHSGAIYTEEFSFDLNPRSLISEKGSTVTDIPVI